MSIRTFWTIFIKIIGIWLVLDSVTVVSQFFSTLIFMFSNDSYEDSIITLLLLVFTIAIYIFILRLFVFKTEWLINKLHLDKGFNEEKIDLNIEQSTIFTIAIIVIGGVMLVDSLPQFCKEVFTFFQQDNLFRNSPTAVWILFHLIKVVLGYLLITNSKQVVSFIQKQTTKQNNN